MTGTILHHCATCGAYVTPDGHDEQACAEEHRRETYRKGRAMAQAELEAAAADRDHQEDQA